MGNARLHGQWMPGAYSREIRTSGHNHSLGIRNEPVYLRKISSTKYICSKNSPSKCVKRTVYVILVTHPDNTGNSNRLNQPRSSLPPSTLHPPPFPVSRSNSHLLSTSNPHRHTQTPNPNQLPLPFPPSSNPHKYKPFQTMRGVQLLLLGSTTFIVHAAPLDRVGRIAGKQKVVNGQDAPEDKYPWVVGLDAVVSGDTYSCGGSLIAPGYVLTAAHCFFPSDGKAAGTVHFGSHETCFYGDCDSETRTIAKAIIHPKYNDRSSANDVAILKLSKPMNTIEPVSIKTVAFNSQDTFGNGINKAAATLGDTRRRRHSICSEMMRHPNKNPIQNV